MKKTTFVLPIFFYVLAIIFLFFACFYFIITYQTIAMMLDSNQSAISITDIIGLYISQVAPLIAYASLLYGVGYIISKMNPENRIVIEEDEESFYDSIDEKIEEIDHEENRKTKEQEECEEL